MECDVLGVNAYDSPSKGAGRTELVPNVVTDDFPPIKLKSVENSSRALI